MTFTLREAPAAPAPPAARTGLDAALSMLSTVILGAESAIRLSLVALLARGHVLVEDRPGLGKTTLARALAKVLGLSARRLQFTSDLLPSDVTGVSVWDPGERAFTFREGPIFTNVLLADEINRSGPRTQSALLEAMSEGTVTADGETRSLPEPFLVIATQNPVEHHGTYPLPDSELDRFLLRIRIGYPSREEERRLVLDRRLSDPMDRIVPALGPDDLAALTGRVRQVSCPDAAMDYLLRTVDATRSHPAVELGVSPRGSLMWFRAAQARALLDGRDRIAEADLRDLAVPVLAHRLTLRHEGESGDAVVASIAGAPGVAP